MNRITLSMDEVEKEILTLFIFFQSGMHFIKIKQILENPRVALCTGNMQIEGTAYLQGHPLNSENAEFCSLYKAKHPHSFERYTLIKDEIVVKVEPSLFTLWKYIEEKPCRDYLNPLAKSAYREFYRI